MHAEISHRRGARAATLIVALGLVAPAASDQSDVAVGVRTGLPPCDGR